MSYIRNKNLVPALERLRLYNRKTQGFKYTKESAANLVSGFRQWVYFTLFFMLPILPATVDHLVCFLELMARTSGYQHLKHLYHSVNFVHQALDISFPANSFQLDMTLQGLKRRLAQVPFQVLPITPKVLRDMFVHLNMRKTEDLALWCAFLVSFYALLRKKNVVPSSSSFDPAKVLCRRHIMISSDLSKIYLYIGFSKTNQFGARDLVIPIPSNDDPALDPVRHISALLTKVKVDNNAPAFSFSKSKYVTYENFTRRLKSLLVKAGYPQSSYSGHSFRRGGATFLHMCGGSALMVQASGDWSSSCFTRYLFLSTQERWNSQLLMARGISTSAV